MSKNDIKYNDTVIGLSRVEREILDDLVRTGLYGTKREEAAERVIAERMIENSDRLARLGIDSKKYYRRR